VYLLTDVYVGYRFADAQMFQEGAGQRELVDVAVEDH
jgi:hypothetical protein